VTRVTQSGGLLGEEDDRGLREATQLTDLKTFDFSMFSDRNLLGLAVQVRAEIARRRKDARSLARAHGSYTEVSAPRYRNPSNGSETWNGHGHMPGWVREALARGSTLEGLCADDAEHT
jgi:hypothetical protein